METDAREGRSDDHRAGNSSAGAAGFIALVNGIGDAAPVLAEAKSLADAARTGWTALHIETPDDPGSAAGGEALALAAGLGGEVASIPASSLSDGLLAYGRDASHFVVGSPAIRRRWWRPSLADQLLGATPSASLVIVPCVAPAARPMGRAGAAEGGRSLTPYFISAAAVLATLPAVLLLHALIGGQGLVLLYLLPVLAIASRLGFGPALLASLFSAATYNYFVLRPTFSFHLGAPQDLLVLGTFVVLSGYLSLLTGRLRRRALLSDRSAQENAGLAALALALTRASDWKGTAEALCRETAALLSVETMVLREVDGALMVAGAFPSAHELGPVDRAALDWAWANGEEAGSGTETLTAANWQFHPLRTSLGTLAVLALARPDGRNPVPTAKRVLLSTIVAQGALAHERLLLEDRMRRGA